MTAKLITAFLILGINFAIGFGLFFFLLLALNGFSERDANFAFIIYIGGAVLITILTAIGGFFLVNFLMKKEWNPFAAASLSVLAFVILGFILKFAVFFIGILAAESMRKSR